MPGRAAAAAGRRAGIDVNVSNVTVASHDGGRDLQITRVARDGRARVASARRARRERKRLRDLERSRRGANRQQYELSKRRAAVMAGVGAALVGAGAVAARSNGSH